MMKPILLAGLLIVSLAFLGDNSTSQVKEPSVPPPPPPLKIESDPNAELKKENKKKKDSIMVGLNKVAEYAANPKVIKQPVVRTKVDTVYIVITEEEADQIQAEQVKKKTRFWKNFFGKKKKVKPTDYE